MRRFRLISPGISLLLIVPLALPAASAGEPVAPGLNDLVVYDPGTHERGLPAVVFNDIEGALKVDIPPKVHVHRYYYSGDKEYQGPIIQGGPVVVVANHPKTGQRMYVDVVLPSGAPRIAYSKRCITYVYPDQRVAVRFQSFPCNTEKALVKYHEGQGVGRTLDQARRKAVSHTKTCFQQSELVTSVKETSHKAGDLVQGATRATFTTAGKLLSGAGGLVNVIPGVTALRSLGEQGPERKRAAEIRGADLRQRRAETPFLPTNR